MDHVHKLGARVIAFIDTPGSALTQPGKSEHLIVYPVNEQLKFFMLANYLMYKNGEFPEYDRYNQEMEARLAKPLQRWKFPQTPGPIIMRKSRLLSNRDRMRICRIILLVPVPSTVRPIPMRCVIGRNRCGFVQNPSAARSFSTACRRSSKPIPR